MAEPQRPDDPEDVAGLLELLRDSEPEPPVSLPDDAMKRVRASITTRDMIDLTTVVFLLKFCAPLMDLIGALIGGIQEPQNDRRTEDDE